jgi:5-methylcytosine-specific restriction endonuclease McrA
MYAMDARMYDPAIARWVVQDPVIHYDFSLYNSFDNNPIYFADPSGGNSEGLTTKYVDKAGKLILDTDDGSDDIVVVPDSRLKEFKELVEYTDPNLYNSQDWNDHFKSEFLGFDNPDEMNSLLDGFSTQWSRQNAIDYLQNPTLANAMAMSYSEALSQWTDPQQLLAAASILAVRPTVGAKVNYSKLKSPNKITTGGKFTQAQKQRILEANRKANGGVLKSDLSGQPLVNPVQSKKGVPATMNQGEVDHIIPRSRGGNNSNGNAQVLSKKENIRKSNN